MITCPICRDKLEEVDGVLKCGHSFHRKCLLDWIGISNTCPCCRRNAIFEIPLTPIECANIQKRDEAFLDNIMADLDNLEHSIERIESVLNSIEERLTEMLQNL